MYLYWNQSCLQWVDGGRETRMMDGYVLFVVIVLFTQQRFCVDAAEEID